MSEIVYLERRDGPLNMARFYSVAVVPTLFGQWAVVRRWGRIGTAGAVKEDWFSSVGEAEREKVRARAVKAARGYCGRCEAMSAPLVESP
jgi:predicted DNA-binding WGR domain protein